MCKFTFLGISSPQEQWTMICNIQSARYAIIGHRPVLSTHHMELERDHDWPTRCGLAILMWNRSEENVLILKAVFSRAYTLQAFVYIRNKFVLLILCFAAYNISPNSITLSRCHHSFRPPHTKPIMLFRIISQSLYST